MCDPEVVSKYEDKWWKYVLIDKLHIGKQYGKNLWPNI